jgi:hypothetical protein
MASRKKDLRMPYGNNNENALSSTFGSVVQLLLGLLDKRFLIGKSTMRYLMMTVLSLLLCAARANADDSRPDCGKQFPKVTIDLAEYDSALLRMREHDPLPANPTDLEWVKRKLKFMEEVDQYMRNFIQNIPIRNGYSGEEKSCFFTLFSPRWSSLDSGNTDVLKALLKTYDWIRISSFGEEADAQAWLIAQHADREPEFQKMVLGRLETLYPQKETNPRNFAYLFDRVAASWNDETRRKPQRFGTQGMCKGLGDWQPIEIEKPEELDTRRASVGLPPFADYKKQMDTLCH